MKEINEQELKEQAYNERTKCAVLSSNQIEQYNAYTGDTEILWNTSILTPYRYDRDKDKAMLLAKYTLGLFFDKVRSCKLGIDTALRVWIFDVLTKEPPILPEEPEDGGGDGDDDFFADQD